MQIVKTRERPGQMAQQARHLPHKPNNSKFNPQNQHKSGINSTKLSLTSTPTLKAPYALSPRILLYTYIYKYKYVYIYINIYICFKEFILAQSSRVDTTVRAQGNWAHYNHDLQVGLRLILVLSLLFPSYSVWDPQPIK